jgi:hypothetical protein
MDQKPKPLTKSELEQFCTSHPSVRYDDNNYSYEGIAENLTLNSNSLVITFKFLFVGNKLLSNHRAIFLNPEIVGIENDILVISHAGKRKVVFSSLIKDKFFILKRKARHKKSD